MLLQKHFLGLLFLVGPWKALLRCHTEVRDQTLFWVLLHFWSVLTCWPGFSCLLPFLAFRTKRCGLRAGGEGGNFQLQQLGLDGSSADLDWVWTVWRPQKLQNQQVSGIRTSNLLLVWTYGLWGVIVSSCFQTCPNQFAWDTLWWLSVIVNDSYFKFLRQKTYSTATACRQARCKPKWSISLTAWASIACTTSTSLQCRLPSTFNV